MNKTHKFFSNTDKCWDVPFIFNCHYMLIWQGENGTPEISFYATLPEAIIARAYWRRVAAEPWHKESNIKVYIVLGCFGSRPTYTENDLREGKVFHWDFMSDKKNFPMYYVHEHENDK